MIQCCDATWCEVNFQLSLASTAICLEIIASIITAIAVVSSPVLLWNNKLQLGILPRNRNLQSLLCWRLSHSKNPTDSYKTLITKSSINVRLQKEHILTSKAGTTARAAVVENDPRMLSSNTIWLVKWYLLIFCNSSSDDCCAGCNSSGLD